MKDNPKIFGMDIRKYFNNMRTQAHKARYTPTARFASAETKKMNDDLESIEFELRKYIA